MTEEIAEIIGKEDGPTSIILAGVHGNEICGVEIIRKILPTLKIDKGRLFIGYGNPRAIEIKKRSTEANLNRMFKDDKDLSETEKISYEYKRAQFLKKYLDQAGVLLDVHASTNPESSSFIICESNAKELFSCFPVDLVVSGFDKEEPGGTDYYMNKNGKIGICVECGYFSSPESLIVAEKSIMSFLSARKHINTDHLIESKKQSRIHIYRLYYSKTDSFVLDKKFRDFEEIKNGQVIGVDGEEKISPDRDSLILFACNSSKKGEEVFLLGEKINSLE